MATLLSQGLGFSVFLIVLVGCLGSPSRRMTENIDDLDKQIDCSFENGMCRWENYYDGQSSMEHDFVYGMSSMLPSDDDLVDRGLFLYVQIRSTSPPGQALLRHDSLVPADRERNVCLRFDYLVTAAYIGRLTLWHYWLNEQNGYDYAAVWSSRGEANYGSWQKGQIYLDGSSSWTLTFEAAVDGPSDDLVPGRLYGIAIDNIAHERVASAHLCPTFPPQTDNHP